MVITYIGNGVYRGLATDTKPTTGISVNAVFIETDTKQVFYWNTFAWTNKQLTTANAQTGVAETLASWKVSDSTSSVEIVNAASTDAVFSPWLRATNLDNTNPALFFYGYIGNALDTGTEAGIRLDARKLDGTALVTRPLFSFRNAATEVMRINAKGDVNQAVIATASTAETLHEWRTTDTSSYIRFVNATATDARFLPQITGRQVEDATMQALTTQARIEAAHDTGTVPVTSFDSRRQGDTPITTRPLFGFRNNGTPLFIINPTGFDFTAHFLDIGEIAIPASPAVNAGRLFFDSADEKLKIKKSGGTVVDLETGGGGGGGAVLLDDLTDVVVPTPTLNHVLTYNGTNWVSAAPPGASGGEANTASNIGTAGVGVFKQKTGVNFELKKINAGSTKITVTDDTGSNEVDIDVAQANLSLSSIGGSVTKAQTPATTVHNDQNNALGAFYQDLAQIAVPADPASGTRRIFIDSATGEMSVRTSTGTTRTLEGSGLKSGTSTQTANGTSTVYNIAHGLGSAPDFFYADPQTADAIGNYTITKDATNIILTYTTPPPGGTSNLVWGWGAGFTSQAVAGFSASSVDTLTNKTIAAGSNTISGIVDANISAHTSTKITITNKALLPGAIAYEDEANTFTSAQRFNSYIDLDKITIPADPGANIGRFYVKQIDANNDGVFVKLKKGGAITEVQML